MYRSPGFPMASNIGITKCYFPEPSVKQNNKVWGKHQTHYFHDKMYPGLWTYQWKTETRNRKEVNKTVMLMVLSCFFFFLFLSFTSCWNFSTFSSAKLLDRFHYPGNSWPSCFKVRTGEIGACSSLSRIS